MYHTIKIPSRSRLLNEKDGYNFQWQRDEAWGRGPWRARRELRRVCNEATLKYLEMLADGVEKDSQEFKSEMEWRLNEARDLCSSIVEFARNKPQSTRVVNRRLKQKLKTQETEAARNARRANAIEELRIQQGQRTFDGALGITTVAADITAELNGLAKGYQEVQAFAPKL